MSVDPLPGSPDDPQSLNRYAYVLDDPVNLVDPFGLFRQCPPGCTPIHAKSADDPSGGGCDCPGHGFTDVFPCTAVYWNGFYMGNTCHSKGEPLRDIRGTARGGRDGDGQPNPQPPTLWARHAKELQDCIARKQAEAERARAKFEANVDKRVLRRMGTGPWSAQQLVQNGEQLQEPLSSVSALCLVACSGHLWAGSSVPVLGQFGQLLPNRPANRGTMVIITCPR